MATTLSAVRPISVAISGSVSEPTAANFPTLKHSFNFGDTTDRYETVGSFTNIIDSITGIELSLGLTSNLNITATTVELYAGALLDEPLTNGGWVQPDTKTVVIYAMYGSAGEDEGLFLMGASGGAADSDALRCNRGANLSVLDFSTGGIQNGVALAADAGEGAMTMLRFTPAVADGLASMQAGDSIVINAGTDTTAIAEIDGLGDVFGVAGTTPIWGAMVFYFDSPPSDEIIALAGVRMQEEWFAGNFVVPNILKEFS